MTTGPELETAHAAATAAITGLIWFVQVVHYALFVERRDAASTTGVVLLGVVWASTVFVQVPLHERLSRAVEPRLVRRLVHTNWIRTFAWTARSVLAFRMVGP